MRTGREWLYNWISLPRAPMIWPFTSLHRSLASSVARMAGDSGGVAAILAARAAFSASVPRTGTLWVMRVLPLGEIQLERTLYLARASTSEFDRPTMPVLAAP